MRYCMNLSRGRFLLRDSCCAITIPYLDALTSSQMAFPGEACPILVYSMCVSAYFRTFVGAAAAYVWLSCHVSCSYFRSMPSRLLRTSVDRSDEALLGCCADDQISIYLPSVRTSNLISFSLILSIQARLVPSSTCTHISLPSRLLFRSRRRHVPCIMQRPQTCSPFRSSSSLSANRLALAYPRHQRPAFVLESHAKGEEPRWVVPFRGL